MSDEGGRRPPTNQDSPLSASMKSASPAERGHNAFAKREWAQAKLHLSEAAESGAASPADLELLALAATLSGQAEECVAAWTSAHQRYLAAGDKQRAARCAFWLGFELMSRGQYAQGGGWMARAESVLADEDCVERGYLILPGALQLFDSGAASEALPLFRQIAEIAERFVDPDLAVLARLGIGQSLLRLGEPSRGTTLLDECMVEVTAGGVSELVAGIVYCAVIEACREMFDLKRAQEWTQALNVWCESQPELITFRGQCLVHRAALLQFRGEWAAAPEEAGRAQELLSIPSEQPAIGAAYFEEGEVHRLRGEPDEAQAAYRQASDWGFDPAPGSALLGLSLGEIGRASNIIEAALEGAPDDLARSRLLPAFIEVVLAAGDIDTAAAAAKQLNSLAANLDSDLLRARAQHAMGLVLLTRGEVTKALAMLRIALAAWRQMENPYEAARVRVLIGRCNAAQGDGLSAEAETAAAREVLERLSAGADLAALARAGSSAAVSGGLTERQAEVLELIVRGKSNREIAAALVISEHTVARHVQNIFAKTGTGSRGEAAAWARDRNLF